jgi:hypothetical protein
VRSAPRPLGPFPLILFTVALSFVSCGPRPPARGSSSGERGPALPRDDIRTVLARRTPELLRIYGVKGTGEGMDAGDTVLVVFVARRTLTIQCLVPREVDGWRVVLREVGTVTAPPN